MPLLQGNITECLKWALQPQWNKASIIFSEMFRSPNFSMTCPLTSWPGSGSSFPSPSFPPLSPTLQCNLKSQLQTRSCQSSLLTLWGGLSCTNSINWSAKIHSLYGSGWELAKRGTCMGLGRWKWSSVRYLAKVTKIRMRRCQWGPACPHSPPLCVLFFYPDCWSCWPRIAPGPPHALASRLRQRHSCPQTSHELLHC